MHSFLFIAFAAIKTFILGMCASLTSLPSLQSLLPPPGIRLNCPGKILFLPWDLLGPPVAYLIHSKLLEIYKTFTNPVPPYFPNSLP